MNRKLVLLTKWLSMIPIGAWMLLAPTLYAKEPMQSNYALMCGFLTLYAVWTRHPRRIIKVIASICVPVVVSWVPMLGRSFFLSVGILVLCVLVLTAIWLKMPQKSGTKQPSAKNNGSNKNTGGDLEKAQPR